jgi:hypothetical protein
MPTRSAQTANRKLPTARFKPHDSKGKASFNPFKMHQPKQPLGQTTRQRNRITATGSP